MAPLNAAGRAALEAFFKGKRGQRQLITTSAVALTDYFAQRGTGLAKKRRFLQIYFFEIHLGKGLPEEKCMEAAIIVGAMAAGGLPAPELQPTIPGEMAAGPGIFFDWTAPLRRGHGTLLLILTYSVHVDCNTNSKITPSPLMIDDGPSTVERTEVRTDR